MIPDDPRPLFVFLTFFVGIAFGIGLGYWIGVRARRR